MRSPARSRYGVTLIELILVLAIAGILLGLGLSRIKPADQVQVDQFLQRVPMIIQKARYDAITRNAFSKVSVGTDGFVLSIDTNPFTDVQTYVVYDDLRVGGTGFEAVTLARTSTTSEIEFEPRGVPRGAGVITARVASTRNAEYSYLITISSQGHVNWMRE